MASSIAKLLAAGGLFTFAACNYGVQVGNPSGGATSAATTGATSTGSTGAGGSGLTGTGGSTSIGAATGTIGGSTGGSGGPSGSGTSGSNGSGTGGLNGTGASSRSSGGSSGTGGCVGSCTPANPCDVGRLCAGTCQDTGQANSEQVGLPCGTLGEVCFFGACKALSCPAPALGPRTALPTGVQPRSVALGDFDGNNFLDLAVANGVDGTVTVLLGTATGAFVTQSTLAVGSSPQSVAVGDFNDDGGSPTSSLRIRATER
ncbi:MAG: FG-GAP-like repeat-containing protein [Myxococcales bacterium]